MNIYYSNSRKTTTRFRRNIYENIEKKYILQLSHMMTKILTLALLISSKNSGI